MANPNNNCRVCKCSLKLEFGNTSRARNISTENLYKPSNRTGSEGTLLADICHGVHIQLVRDPELYSERVCNPCARKIRNLGNLFALIKSSVNQRVKVLLVQANGNVIVRIRQDENSKLLVKHIAFKNWQSASNILVNHCEILPQFHQAIKKLVSKEFHTYQKSENILQRNEPRTSCLCQK